MAEQAMHLKAAAARVDYRLTYGCTPSSREVHGGGIDGPSLPNSYWHMRGGDQPGNTNPDYSSPGGSGEWCDPEHPSNDAPEADHIARWFETAIREAAHEAMEWFWVDGEPFLDPHGDHEAVIHDLSGEFAAQLIALRETPRG